MIGMKNVQQTNTTCSPIFLWSRLHTSKWDIGASGWWKNPFICWNKFHFEDIDGIKGPKFIKIYKPEKVNSQRIKGVGIRQEINGYWCFCADISLL